MQRRRNNTWREEELTSVEEDLTCELKCPVCLELLTWPIILPCSHVLCKDPCADRLFRNGFVRCPVCRDDSYVSGGINSLPRVITLEHIIERVSQRSRTISSGDEDSGDVIEFAGPEDVACQLCSGSVDQLPPFWIGPAIKAVKMCLHCNVSYCKSCLRLSHPDRPPFSQHNMVDPRKPVDQVVQEQDRQCSLHELIMEGFCCQCKTFVCKECSVQPDDLHLDHEVMNLSEAVNLLTVNLNDQLTGLEFCQSTVEEEISQHQACLASLQRLLAEKRSQIHSECDSLINEIENKRQFFLSDLQYDERNKMAAITSVLEDRRTRSRDLEEDILQAKDILVETDPRSFIRNAAAYMERNTRCFQHAPNELTPAVLMSLVTSSGHKVLDLRKEKAVLKDISYLTVPGTPKIDVSKCYRSTSSVVLVLSTQNLVDVVTDGYLVFYSTDNTTKPEGWDQIDFKSPGEPRKFSRGSGAEAAICLMHDNLRKATVYYFGVCAYNASGRSDISQIAQCSTLSESQTTLRVPSIVEDRCRTFTFSTQLRSSVPLEESPDMSILHYLLFREAGEINKIWKSISLFGRCDHRVFGLESDTWYQFVIMSCDKNSECQVSNAVTLKTERSAY